MAKNEAEAVKWFRKAAEQGFAKAQNGIGFMYEAGPGVVEDKAEAAKWYRKAAEQESAITQLSLGVMYANGQSVARNDVTAYMWAIPALSQTKILLLQILTWLNSVMLRPVK